MELKTAIEMSYSEMKLSVSYTILPNFQCLVFVKSNKHKTRQRYIKSVWWHYKKYKVVILHHFMLSMNLLLFRNRFLCFQTLSKKILNTLPSFPKPQSTLNVKVSCTVSSCNFDCCGRSANYNIYYVVKYCVL